MFLFVEVVKLAVILLVSVVSFSVFSVYKSFFYRYFNITKERTNDARDES